MRVSFPTVKSSWTKWYCLWGALETIGCDWCSWTEVCMPILRRWGEDDVETGGWADGKMPTEACDWWPGTILLLVLVHVYATGMVYFLDPVALVDLSG